MTICDFTESAGTREPGADELAGALAASVSFASAPTRESI